MNKEQFEQYNSIPKEKFAFAKQGEVIHDKKLDTKAVSYARDSFRRFCKNKASVVAAIILGIIILLSIIVPEITGYDTTEVSIVEKTLAPKLFKAGTGFWDGTEKHEKKTNLDGTINAQVYDTKNEVPVGFVKSAVMKLVVDEEPTLINSASPYGLGGYVMFENQASDGETVNALTSDTFSLTASGGYAVKIVFGNTADALGGTLGEYRILLTGGEEDIVLQDWSTNYADATLMLSNQMQSAGVTSIENARLKFELKSTQGQYSYVLIESCVFSANETVTNADRLAEVGFVDATQMVLLAQDGLGRFPAGYWTCNGRKGIFAASIYYCSFVYDTYEAAYGKFELVYAKSELDKLVEQGLCSYSYDPETDTVTFEKLSDDCPIEDIVGHKINVVTKKIQEVTAVSYRWRQMGYKKMPKFLFGTDASGVDVFTRMFKSLRTSLTLGLATFAFCFLFGLVWGSISGYFGGAVDLAMERFTDILGGVPWIVIMTLCILHLGNNFFTFFLALCMTDWMGPAAGTRTQFYRFKNMEHVLAARTLGARDMRLIFKHILPNSLGTIITSSVLMIPSVIYSEATLAYLGLGLQGTASFGVMLSQNQQYLATKPYLIVIPSIVMALLMISFNLFGNGLRDAVNPTLKGSEG